jgi:multiple sugar transport system substrate-binding protein
MSSEDVRSPSPTEVGYLLGRRRFIVGAASVGASAVVLGACGSDSGTDTATTEGGGSDTTVAEAETDSTEAAGSESGSDVGTITFGSNYSDEKPKAALAAAMEATGLDVEINTVDHNTYQENFNTYIQQPDDVVSWFAGYRMRAFATKGVVGDISDVWAALPDLSDGFKNASTGLDGKQYFVPFYFYAWGVHYRKSLFEEKGYEIPTTWEEFLALCEQMEADGITPLAAGNDGRWPQMGMFDMLNLRVNGYDFHVSLMGGQESWTGPEVTEVFERWAELLPYYQPDANGRTVTDAATALGDKSAGMFLIGNFVTENYTDQEIIDDIDFFLFPEINPEHGQDAIEAPIDGFMMAAEPANEEGAKALLTAIGGSAAIDAYIAANPAVVAANSSADTSGYNPLQEKAAALVGSSKFIAQFLDRDTDPSFAADVVGIAIADFVADPSKVESVLSTVEAQKATYTFE